MAAISGTVTASVCRDMEQCLKRMQQYKRPFKEKVVLTSFISKPTRYPCRKLTPSSSGEKLRQLHSKVFKGLNQVSDSRKLVPLIKSIFGTPGFYRFDVIARQLREHISSNISSDNDRLLKALPECHIEGMPPSVLEAISEIDDSLDLLIREFFSEQGPFGDMEEDFGSLLALYEPIRTSIEIFFEVLFSNNDFVVRKAKDITEEFDTWETLYSKNQQDLNLSGLLPKFGKMLSELKNRITNKGKREWTTKKMVLEAVYLHIARSLICRESLRKWFQKIPTYMRLEVLKRLVLQDQRKLVNKKLFGVSDLKYLGTNYVWLQFAFICSLFDHPDVKWLFARESFSHKLIPHLFFDAISFFLNAGGDIYFPSSSMKCGSSRWNCCSGFFFRMPYGFVYYSLNALRRIPRGEELIYKWWREGLTRSLLESTCELALSEEVTTLSQYAKAALGFPRISLSKRATGAEETLIVRGSASLDTWDIVCQFYRNLDLHNVHQSKLAASLGTELLALLWEETFLIEGALEPSKLNFASQIENFIELEQDVYRLKDPVNVKWFDTLMIWIESTRPELTESFVKVLFIYFAIASPSGSLDPGVNPRIAGFYPLLSDDMRQLIDKWCREIVDSLANNQT